MTENKPVKKQASNIGIDNPISAKVTLHSNVDQSYITITEDKAILIIEAHLKKINAAKSWQVPLGVLLPLGLAIVTTEFKSAFGLPADRWETVVYLGTAASSVWTIVNVYRSWKNRGASTENIINAMKKMNKK